MISLTLLFLAGAFRGLAEILAFNHDQSIFSGRVKPTSFFGSSSWKRKYAFKYSALENVFKEAPKNWYYSLFKLKHKERFPLSATALVWFTDGFHFSDMIMRLLVTASCITASWGDRGATDIAWISLAYLAAWSGGFNLTYSFIFRKK